MGEIVLELDGLSKRFGRTVTADSLSLTVDRGEFFTFLGPSGSGKSTILRMIAGLVAPNSGRIAIDGEDVAKVPPWRRNLGMMFQQYAVFPHMNVAENIGYGLKVRGAGRAEIDRRVAEMIDLVGLGGLAGNSVTNLSGGEQQRVALARALAPSPRMLLLDEPLSALDEKIRRAMQTELSGVHKRTGTTFLYVTHDQEEALTMSSRIAVVNGGRMVQCDVPERLYKRPRTRFVADFFRGCNVLRVEPLREGNGNPHYRLAGAPIEIAPGDGMRGRWCTRRDPLGKPPHRGSRRGLSAAGCRHARGEHLPRHGPRLSGGTRRRAAARRHHDAARPRVAGERGRRRLRPGRNHTARGISGRAGTSAPATIAGALAAGRRPAP